jgi:hypothetical protein
VRFSDKKRKIPVSEPAETERRESMKTEKIKRV